MVRKVREGLQASKVMQNSFESAVEPVDGFEDCPVLRAAVRKKWFSADGANRKAAPQGGVTINFSHVLPAPEQVKCR